MAAVTIGCLSFAAINMPDSFEITDNIGKLDARTPTVAFLDHFDRQCLPDGTEEHQPCLTHGELSARAAEQQGFNSLRLNVKLGSQSLFDFGKPLAEVQDAIKKGELPLGPGDVLNVSLAQQFASPFHSPSFEQVSKILGFTVTRENLKDKKDAIVDRMRVLAADPKVEPRLRNRLDFATRSNDAIDGIQRLGVEIAHSAGNLGPDQLDLDFLTAKHNLSATDENGKVLGFSADNSDTIKGVGSYTMKYHPIDWFNPTKIIDQRGRYKMGALPVYLSSSEYRGPSMIPPPRIADADREQVVRDVWKQMGSTVFRNEPLGPAQSFEPAELKFSTRKSYWLHLDEMALAHAPIKLSHPWDGVPVAKIEGTSFVNAQYLPTQLERLKALKRSTSLAEPKPSSLP